MTDFNTIINNRRSIRSFTDEDISIEDIEKMLKAAMQAPGSRMGSEPWEFIIVKNKETIEKLSDIAPSAKPLKTATLAIVGIANMERVHYPTVWQQDMSAAVENLLLEACNLGLGAVWLGVAPDEDKMSKISEIFHLDETLRPFNLIAMGYPAEGTENKFIDKFDKSRIHLEKY